MDFTATLEAGGYVVAGSTASVSEALATLEGILPHACVLDVNLRGQTSAPVAEELRRLAVPFVLSCAYKEQAPNEYPAFVT